MTHPFLQPQNKYLLYELSQDLMNKQYKFHELTSDIIIPKITQQLEEFLEVQQQMIHKQRFHYSSVKEMNKDVLKEVNTFLYHLYKQYKNLYKNPQNTQNTQIQEIYSRPQETQAYKHERQTSLEHTMKQKQQELDQFTPKPKEIDFKDKEDSPLSLDEMESMIRQRQAEYEQPVLNQHGKQVVPQVVPQVKQPTNDEPPQKKVSFGIAKEKAFDKEKPTNSISSQSRTEHTPSRNPSLDTLFSKLKPKSVDIPHSPDVLKRIGVYLATSNVRHHFIRLRGERDVQTDKQKALLLVNTITHDLPIELGEYLQPFEEYLLRHADTIWKWWVFMNELVSQKTPDTKRWLRYIELDCSIDFTTYSFLKGWLDQEISIPS